MVFAIMDAVVVWVVVVGAIVVNKVGSDDLSEFIARHGSCATVVGWSCCDVVIVVVIYRGCCR